MVKKGDSDMQCIFPPELDDRQLLLYLDGIAELAAASHLEQCAYCRESARALALLQARLKTRLYRIACPTSIELGEYHLRMLPAPQRLVIAQHLRECPHCARETALLENFLDGPSPTPQGSPFGKARLLVARLVGRTTGPGLSTENRPSTALSALRGEGQLPLTLEADGVVIVLDVQASGTGRLAIRGQLAATDQVLWADASVECRHDNQLESVAKIDDLGAFYLESVLPGQKDLRIFPKRSSVVIVSGFEVPA
jgi:hypothetical protein